MFNEVLTIARATPKLLQFTDLHLSDNDTLMGINCNDSLMAVKQLSAQYNEIDLTLLTGDLSQDHSKISYQYCCDVFRDNNHSVVWISGNHDDFCLQKKVLSQGAITPIKRVLFDHWQLLLLNSQIIGKVRGEITTEELAAIKQSGIDYPDHHLMLVMHHHPIPMNSHWIDEHHLINKPALWNVISQTPQVKSIVFGHVHQAVDHIKQDVRVLGAPSTSVQFAPLKHEFTVDEAQPGFRYLELLPDGTINTQVHRLPANSFNPVDDPAGY